MRIAVLGDGVVGVAIYRVLVNTHLGRHLYVDDHVTADGNRSAGVGRALLASLEATARAEGCTALILDSGTQRRRAHAFYLRERMEITAFHFLKGLG